MRRLLQVSVGILVTVACCDSGVTYAGDRGIGIGGVSGTKDARVTCTLDPTAALEAAGTMGASTAIPCEGAYYETDELVDSTAMGGWIVAFAWVPGGSSPRTITRVELFTGENSGPNIIAIWSHDAANNKPLFPLAHTSAFPLNLVNSWQGADLESPLTVQPMTQYWVAFRPISGQQAPVQNGIGQTYWGGTSGDVTSNVTWDLGPFSSPQAAWKFRAFCCAAPPQDMVGWWPFDETAGPTAIDLVGWHPGSYMSPTPDAGVVGSALRFRDVSNPSAGDVVIVPHTPSFNFGKGSLTIDAWINYHLTGGYAPIMIKKSGAFQICLFPMTSMGTHIHLGGYHQHTDVCVPENQWTHLAVTVEQDGSSVPIPNCIKYYVNGLLMESQTPPTTYNLTCSDPLSIGGTVAGSLFEGLLDEVEIFDRALSASEVHAIYTAGRAGKCKSNIFASGPDGWIKDDAIHDVGNQPNNETNQSTGGVFWVSDDIWVRNSQDTRVCTNPDRFLKEHVHVNPEYAVTPSAEPWVYAKVINRGDQPVSGAVRLYWANASTGLPWPGSWTEISPANPASITNLAPGAAWVVERQWTDIPNPTLSVGGHFCLLARFESSPAGDDPIGPEGTSVWDNVSRENNIAWKNVTIVDMDPGNIATPIWEEFIVRSVSAGAALVNLEFSILSPDSSDPFLNHGRVFVRLGTVLLQHWQSAGGGGSGVEVINDSTVEVVDPVAHITGIPMEPAEEHEVSAGFALRPGQDDLQEQRFEFTLAQFEQGVDHPDGGLSYDIRLNSGCFATGDVNGDGIILTVADLIQLTKFVNFGGPPPNPLYQGDLNGDGVIDQADIDIFNCYFINGLSCFSVFPAPTSCDPDTIRGCCCGGGGCAVRSPSNCDAIDGTYSGNGLGCCHEVYIDTVRTLNGLAVTVPVSHAGAPLLTGGFDLLVSYDASALTFLSAAMGWIPDSLEWEYFTYRTGAVGNCVGGCPSGLVRLVAIADLDNGPSQHPLESTDPGELAILRFQVTSDRNFIGQCIPVRFYWNDCGDNVFSSVSGDTTYVDQSISSPDGLLLWDEEDDVQFPESARPAGIGTPDSCLVGGGPGKPLPERRICFSNGWVCIDEPPDDRGDLNLNGVANEIGDAVLYTNYFVYGSSVWSPPYQDVQLLASDINDDGVVLTVADLIYLIRVITGDEQPFPPGGNPKTTPYANSGSATVRTENDRLIVSTTSPVDVGGAWLVFRYDGMATGEPALLAAANGMDMRYNAGAGELRVLIHPSWDGEMASIGAGSQEILSVPTIGSGTIELVEVQISDASGALLSTAVAKSFVPKSYALLQNYPNPFNAGTVIAFDLIEDADWDLTIFNVLGQTMRRFEGNNGAGRVSVTWDGRTDGGNSASSGIYLYRVSANGFTATKKMTLVK